MSRKLGVCWMFLWITTAVDVSADYVLSNESKKWNDASDKSNFATPNIQVNNSTFTVNITTYLKDEEAWVGYYKKETAFAYIGCGRLNNVELEVLLPELKNSPGLCYSMCNKSNKNYIGLNKDKCICMSVKPSGNLSLSGCSHKYHGYWIAGGGNDSMSIYKKIKTGIQVNSNSQYNTEHCLAFQNDRKHWWKSCTVFYRTICKKDGNTFLVSHAGGTFFDWWGYVQLCFERESLPVTYTDTTTLDIEDASSQSWTNVIRSEVLYKYTETSFKISHEDVVSYGYISIRGNVTELSFTENSSDKKRYLLQTHEVTSPNGSTSLSTGNVPNTTTSFSTGNEPNTTTSFSTGNEPNTTTSFSTRNEPNSSTSFKGPNSISTSTASVNNGLLNSSETFQRNKHESTSESSGVSVPVSISVVAVIIVAVIITIITLKRRGKLQGICTKSSALNNLSKRTSDMIPADNKLKKYESAVDDYEQISELKDINNGDVKPDLGVENGNYGHTYFILEPGSRESHTDGDMSNSKTEINDDYNTLHLNKTFGAKADDTYDTTEKAAIKLKALRNTVYEKESPEKLHRHEEDTYNHINRNLFKNTKTDHIYGVPDNQENDYGDVNNVCEKNRQNGDDTYNHLNTTH